MIAKSKEGEIAHDWKGGLLSKKDNVWMAEAQKLLNGDRDFQNNSEKELSSNIEQKSASQKQQRYYSKELKDFVNKYKILDKKTTENNLDSEVKTGNDNNDTNATNLNNENDSNDLHKLK